MIIGIDLGTSTSEVSVLRNGKPMLIREVRHAVAGIMASVVGIDRRGAVCVGTVAETLLVQKPDFAVQEVKRLMGTDSVVSIGGEEYRPQEISAFILRHLKEEAERYLGEPITEAVITVPAFWRDAARKATVDAGELAGLKVRRLINEPTAAALAYGVERPGVEEKILVYDLGGGTLDVTVLELSEGILDVIASVGNPQLGGKEFDELLMRFLADECRKNVGIDLLAELKNRQKLKSVAKGAKEALSSVDSTLVVLENLGIASNGSAIDFEYELTRDQLESLIRDLVESTQKQVDAALAEKKVSRDEINTILMIGGSTRMPLVRSFVSGLFGGKALRTDVSPDEAVSLGAAVLGGIEGGNYGETGVIITDVSPHTFGVATSTEVDGRVLDNLLSPLIERQSTIPRTSRKTFSTMHDWQERVHVRVFQGESRFCDENEPVGDFHHDLAPAPAGAPLEIEMSYNLDGMIEVVARDPKSGRESKLKIAPDARRLSDEEKVESKRRIDKRWKRESTGAGTSPAVATGSSQTVQGSSSRADTSSSEKQQDWREHPLYAPMAALVTHAERRLPVLGDEDCGRVRDLLRALREAVLKNNPKEAESLERRLTDLLFDLE
jgi:molecular chaperone DnaK